MSQTSKKLFIILFAFIALVNCTIVDEGRVMVVTPSELENRRKLANKYCIADQLSMFVDMDSSEKFPAVAFASKEIKEICPSMDMTCCSLKQLKTSTNEFLRGYQQFTKIKVFGNGIIDWFNVIGAEKILEVIRESNREKKDLETFMASAGTEVKTLFKSLKSLSYDWTNVQKTVRKYYAGFICEFCSPSLYDSFHLPRNNLDGQTSLDFKFKNLKDFKDMIKEVYAFLARHWNMIRVIQNLKGESLENFPLKIESEEELNQGIAAIDECFTKFKTAADFSKDDLCESIRKTTGLFVDFDLFKDIRNIYQYVDTTLKSKFRMNPTIFLPENLAEQIKFYEYRQSQFNLNNIQINLEDDKGFDMIDNKLNPIFWASDKLIKTVAVFLAAFFMM